MYRKLMQGASLESIKFQTGVFFHELTALYDELRKAKIPARNLEKSSELQAIARCINHHTGVSVRMVVGSSGPAVIIPQVHRNHPFIEEWMRGYLGDGDVFDAMRKAKGILHGSVDLANSRVSGIFSDIVLDLIMPAEWLNGTNGVTPEECAAVTLHENGHLFTYYEFISRTCTTNQVLAALHRGYAQADSIDKREMLLITAKKALQLKEEGVAELAKSSNYNVVSSVILTDLIEQSRSQMGVNIYDINSWEYLADEFAARHQAGKHLITALDKIMKDSGHMSYRKKGLYVVMEALKFGWLLSGLIALPIAPGYSILSLFAFMSMVSTDSDIVTYDEPEARMRRIKQQIIQAMKDRRLSKEEVDRMADELKTIDAIMEHVKDKRQWLDVILEKVSKTSRDNRKSVLLQQELETIANNELFAKAAQLRQVGA